MAILSKKAMNFAYGMGAAVVIVGALFKITHFEIGPLTGTLMLSIGLLTEALIFALSAADGGTICMSDASKSAAKSPSSVLAIWRKPNTVLNTLALCAVIVFSAVRSASVLRPRGAKLTILSRLNMRCEPLQNAPVPSLHHVS